MIKVLLVSDYPMTRAGLRALLDGQDDIDVVGEAVVRDDLSFLVSEVTPDLILIDLPGHDELEPLARIAGSAPGVSLVVLSGDPSGALAARALSAGARGYLFKEAAREELLATVRAVSEGLVVLHPAAAMAAVGDGQHQQSSAGTEGGQSLTARELEVLVLVAQGLPNKTIANRLHLSEHTVKFHVGSIIGKLGAASRTEAVSLGVRRGLIAL